MTEIHDDFTLYIQQSESGSSVSLCVTGHSPSNSYITLLLTGGVSASDDCPLFIDGYTYREKYGYLYINGYTNEINSYSPLFIQVGTDGLYGTQGNMTLYMPTPMQDHMGFLFIKNTQASVPQSLARTLIINGAVSGDYGSINLFLNNTGEYDVLPLYIKAPGTWKNHIPSCRGIPLFINRPDESVMCSLFCKAYDDGANSYIPLHIYSTIQTTDDMTLVIPNVVSPPVNSYINSFIAGHINLNDDISLYNCGFLTANSYLNMVVNPNNGAVNSYTSLFINGVYIIDNNMILVMPDVYSYSYTALPAYIFGWG
jgi:hypothetical protein